MGRRIRDGQLQKVPYLLVVGDKEQETREVAVRERGEQKGSALLADAVTQIAAEIAERAAAGELSAARTWPAQACELPGRTSSSAPPRPHATRPCGNVTRRAAIVILTTSGHTVTMESVSVAELKAKLSPYLREVREGKSFTVLSRDIPVATLGPSEPDEVDDLEIIEPTEDPALWGQVDLPPLALSRDIVDYLIEVRQDRDLGLAASARAPAHPRGMPNGAQVSGSGPDTGEVDE